MRQRVRVAVIGMATIDCLYTVERYPTEDAEAEVTQYAVVVGGAAGRGALTAARLGGDVTLFATIGTGIHADLLRSSLEEEGVRATWAEYDQPSQHSAVMLSTGTSSRTILWLGQPSIDESRLPEVSEFVSGADVALVDGTDEALARAAIDACREQRIPTVMDTGSGRPWTESLLDGVDYVIAPQKYFPRWAGAAAPDPDAMSASRHGNRVVAATRGSNGGSYMTADSNDVLSWDAYPVEAVDTCGAGDTFHGAFAWAIGQGIDLPESLQIAAAAAALKVQSLGNDGLPSDGALFEFLAAHAGGRARETIGRRGLRRAQRGGRR